MTAAEEETARLANYLMENWPHEIGVGDPERGESAVDVAIRLLRRLEDLERTGESHDVETVLGAA